MRVYRIRVNKRKLYTICLAVVVMIGMFISSGAFLSSAYSDGLVGIISTKLRYPQSRERLDFARVINALTGFDVSNPVTIVQDSFPVTHWVATKEIKGAAVNEDEPMGKITQTTIEASASSGYASYDNVFVKNSTIYSIDTKDLFEQPLKYSPSDDPTVLILHSHATESYKPTDANYYKQSDTDRTQDTKYNVVRVGQEMTQVLKEAGISVIHDKTLHDYPDYNSSYLNSLKTIKHYIDKYPSIQVVIDVHRDAMVRGDNTLVKAVTQVEGQKVAQVMTVCGSDLLGLEHKGWRDNLSFAVKLQNKMNSLYPCLARPIDFRNERFNQHMTPNSIILEVGSNANSLEEAILGGKYAASALARLLSE
ncbi:MAG: stage II sporulation protein P [Eubacteriales bacterium]|nr:stage II sporulation protein P [Eubacteriales bacterium]